MNVTVTDVTKTIAVVDLDETERFELTHTYRAWPFTVHTIRITFVREGNEHAINITAFGHRRLKDGREGSTLSEGWRQTGRFASVVPPQVRAVVEQAGYLYALTAPDGTE
jgi:hypothetical protein